MKLTITVVFIFPVIAVGISVASLVVWNTLTVVASPFIWTAAGRGFIGVIGRTVCVVACIVWHKQSFETLKSLFVGDVFMFP